jgi:hypothetical protein
MLILIFVVFFGPKKGVLASYLTYWLTNFRSNFKTLVNMTDGSLNFNKIVVDSFYNFQFTVITSRTTIYVLFTFWCFFFFFGEFLLLALFNFNTISDLITSNYFTFFKTHTVFMLDNSNNYLNEVIFFYILFFTTSAILFLLNLKYTLVYDNFYHQFTLDLIFSLVILVLFHEKALIVYYLIWFLRRLNSY